MKVKTFDVYEYPLKDINGKTYYGSYTIIAGLIPLHFKDEKLVDTFSALVKE